MELSGATVRLKVLPKHFPEHGQNLCGTGEVHRLSSVFYSKFTNSRERLLKRVITTQRKWRAATERRKRIWYYLQ